MDELAVFQGIEQCGIIAGTRGNFPPDVWLTLAESLLSQDINVFEFTMNSVQPIEAMQAVKQEFGDDVFVGMGTALSVDDARRAVNAGADFVVSPAFQRDVVAYVKGKGKLVAPGVITPTEAVEAWEMGVRFLKLFPIGPLGIHYFKSMFGPLNHMRFSCHGGIDDRNTYELIQAGAMAVGTADWLVGDGTWTPNRIRSRARLLRNAVDSARTGQEPTKEV